MEKTDARKLGTDAQQQLRYQVIRLRKQGRTHREISEITGVARATCNKWWSLYQAEGIKALKIKKRGRPKGSCRTLSPEQEAELRRAIVDRTPDQLKLKFALWTRREVMELVFQLWGIRMPIRTAGEYLMRWGFTPQKPIRKAYEQDQKAVKNGWTRRTRTF